MYSSMGLHSAARTARGSNNVWRRDVLVLLFRGKS